MIGRTSAPVQPDANPSDDYEFTREPCGFNGRATHPGPSPLPLPAKEAGRGEAPLILNDAHHEDERMPCRSSSSCLFRHGRVSSRPSTRLRFRPIRRCSGVSLNFQTRPGAGWRVWAIEMLNRAFAPLDGGRPSRGKPKRSAAQKSRIMTKRLLPEIRGLLRDGTRRGADAKKPSRASRAGSIQLSHSNWAPSPSAWVRFRDGRRRVASVSAVFGNQC